MEMILSHKIRLKPNKEQAVYFVKAAGVARFAYNWGLSQWKSQYDSGQKVSEWALRKQLNSIKRDEFPWMMEVTKCAPQQAIMNLGVAFKNFFKTGFGYPQFHKKSIHDSFYISNDQFQVDGKYIKIPKLGWVKMTEQLRFDGKIMAATISRRAKYWFVSIGVQTSDFSHLRHAENQGSVGVDLGIKTLVTLSTGEKFAGLKPYKHLFRRIKRLQQSLSRKIKGSNNRQKAKDKLVLLHYRVACIRQDYLHKLTSEITRRFDIIGIEDLNVSGMLKNHKLAKSISDMGLGEFRRQLEYKCKIRDRELIVADRFYPSSKTCSNCGYKLDKLSLSVRQWQCHECGSIHDRDINAAINLKQIAGRSSVTACGDFLVPDSSTKQEFFINNC